MVGVLTASVAVAPWNNTVAPLAFAASKDWSAGRVIAGGVVSTTVTLKEAVDWLPLLSIAVHWMTVVPRGKVLPDAGVAVTETAPSTASFAVAEKATSAPAALVASAVMSAGTVITGGVVSPTVTGKLPVAVFPAASFAVTMTIVVPSGN